MAYPGSYPDSDLGFEGEPIVYQSDPRFDEERARLEAERQREEEAERKREEEEAARPPPVRSAEPVSISDLPDPESLIGDDIPEEPPAFAVTNEGAYEQRSAFGALGRALKGIPSCVWVMNKHTQPITVVVSQFKPSRLLTKAGVNASATGGGIDFEAQVYHTPATTKPIAPGKSGRFPLWSKDDYGVLSIGKESDESFVKNDWIPAGATAVFTAGDDLKLYDFKGKPWGIQQPVILD